ncbi:MAG: hypothetical protein J6M39_06410 [Lachnospiraceae bacterium]|nr:hypothetical protein [Lachnospiraceae bacterium]
MKNYVTKKEKEELWFLWKQIELDLRVLYKKHRPLRKLKFNIIIENLNLFIQNSYWRKKYKKATSYICKLYIAIQYCRSYDAFIKMKDTMLQNECIIAECWIENCLSIEDYEYMRDKVTKNVQAKITYNSIINLFKSLKDGDEFTIEPHGREIYNPDFVEKFNRK